MKPTSMQECKRNSRTFSRKMFPEGSSLIVHVNEPAGFFPISRGILKGKSWLILVLLLIVFKGFTQTDIPLVNSSFEDKGSFAKVKGWDGACSDAGWTDLYDVPGWSSDSPAKDSGIESADVARNDGSASWAFLMFEDPMVWQTTDHTIAEGDVFSLYFRMGSTWKCTAGTAYMYYQLSSGRVLFDSLVISDLVDGAALIDATFISKSIPAGDASIGQKLGVGFANTSANWMGLDDIRLSYTGKTAKQNLTTFAEPLMFITDQVLKIRSANCLSSTVSVFSPNGNCLIKKSYEGEALDMPVQLTRGIYLIQLKNNTGTFSTKVCVE